MVQVAEPENGDLATRPVATKMHIDENAEVTEQKHTTNRAILGELPANQRLGPAIKLDNSESQQIEGDASATDSTTAGTSIKRSDPFPESPSWRKRARDEAIKQLSDNSHGVNRHADFDDQKENRLMPVVAATLSLAERLQLALSKDKENAFDTLQEIEHDDLDSDYQFDPIMVQEYEPEIFEHLYKTQAKYIVGGDFLSSQTEFSWIQRGMVINWLISVHSKFRLTSETLFIAINMMDRYLERKVIGLSSLQKIGLTCLFIATKYEEIMCPTVQAFAYMANLEGDDIVEAEREILRVIEWSIVYTHPLNFLRRISKVDDFSDDTRTFAKFLIETTLFIPSLIEFAPSALAAASACLARVMLELPEPWNNNAAYYSGGYRREDLEPLMDAIVEFLAGPIYHADLFKKFATRKFMKVSIVAREWSKAYVEQHKHTKFS